MNKRELIYSQQATDFVEGRAYSNPRFFSTPRRDVSKVLLVGDWPNIEAAYKAIGVPVERLSGAPAPRQVAAASPLAMATAEEASKVAIPDNWRDLPWTHARVEGGLTLRSLSSSVSATPILNKTQAAAAIDAELARRAASEG